MKIILAQGNPGVEYKTTRHNVGFLAVDFFAKQQGIDFLPKPKFFADIAEFTHLSEKVLLVKPATYYNDTGKSARAIVDFYKIATHDILVIHDELALPFGSLRTREKGSDAGNNGIKSLNTHLGENYTRIRIGTWNDTANKQDSVHFVLSNFTSDEIEKLHNDIFPKVSEIIDDFITGNHTSTSHSL